MRKFFASRLAASKATFFPFSSRMSMFTQMNEDEKFVETEKLFSREKEKIRE
jgi:hypothetical protein